ncbi:MAG: hypothetical protein J4F28_08595 [Nitrosopumilaceae archaeon]|nr:hypothetical protein [Nitrosopumilaceae archaeon]
MPEEPLPQPQESGRQMRLSDIAPNFRCRTIHGRKGKGGGDTDSSTTWVEIPQSYARYVQAGLPPELRGIIMEVIAGLCKKSPDAHASAVYDEVRDDGRSTVRGWLVPLSDWAHAMQQPLPGWYVNDDRD